MAALVEKLARMKPLPMPALSGLDYLPNLTKVRRKKGLTREELAHSAGVNEKTIRRAEGAINTTNGCGLSLHTAVAIAEALGTGLDELIGTEKRTPPPPAQAHEQLKRSITNWRPK